MTRVLWVQAGPSTGHCGYCPPPITTTHLPTEICMKTADQSGEAYSKMPWRRRQLSSRLLCERVHRQSAPPVLMEQGSHWPDKPPTFCQLSLVRKMLSSWVAFSLSHEKQRTSLLPVRHADSGAQRDVQTGLLVFLHESLRPFATVEQVSAAERRVGKVTMGNKQLTNVLQVEPSCRRQLSDNGFIVLRLWFQLRRCCFRPLWSYIWISADTDIKPIPELCCCWWWWLLLVLVFRVHMQSSTFCFSFRLLRYLGRTLYSL